MYYVWLELGHLRKYSRAQCQWKGNILVQGAWKAEKGVIPVTDMGRRIIFKIWILKDAIPS
jgi:hypothetical protein